jgi:hypothetical protein
LNLGLHDGVHMIGPYMRGQQVPTALGTMPPQTRKHNRSGLPVKHIGILQHSLTFQLNPLWTGFQQAASYQIVTAILADFFTVPPVSGLFRNATEPRTPVSGFSDFFTASWLLRAYRYARISATGLHFAQSIAFMSRTPPR